MSIRNTAAEVRRSLWHLRRGGVAQYRTYRARDAAATGNGTGGGGIRTAWWRPGKKGKPSFQPVEPLVREPRRADLNVAVILDEFSEYAFTFEWNLIRLGRDTWRDQLSHTPIDFVFIESAWAGNGGDWRYELTGTSGPKEGFRELLRYCRERQLTTIFWNKEDPAHFEDFLSAAMLFDVVFTTDSDRLEDYRRALGHDRVGVLQFAAQPAVHNPVRPRYGWRSRDVAFAGMYFAHKYPERRDQLTLLLDGAKRALGERRPGLEIYSRVMTADYEFPEEYRSHVVGSLGYAEMLTAHKAYKIFLNANSVVDSPTMCARRVFELAACGTSVLTTPSLAIDAMFEDDEVAVVRDTDEAERMTRILLRNPAVADRMLHRAQRKIWTQHTYSHRAETVVEAWQPARTRPVERPSVSALVPTIRPHLVERLFTTLAAQEGVDVELVLLTHGFELAPQELDRLKRTSGLHDVVLLTADRSASLGSCLNSCVAAAGGPVLTKLDDDDYYGPNYVLDQSLALRYSAADIVGKQAHYMYLEKGDATLLRFPEKEHRFTDMVMGPTLLGTRSVFDEVKFPDRASGEDSAFLAQVSVQGGSIYSADRYNYCQYRGSHQHTWKIDSDELLASSCVEIFGEPTAHVTL